MSPWLLVPTVKLGNHMKVFYFDMASEIILSLATNAAKDTLQRSGICCTHSNLSEIQSHSGYNILIIIFVEISG